MGQERFTYLLQQFKSDRLSTDEWNEFRRLVESGDYHNVLVRDFDQLLNIYKAQTDWTNEHAQSLLQRLHEQLDFTDTFQHSRPRGLWLRYAAAAILLLVFGTALFYFGTKNSRRSLMAVKKVSAALVPGGNKATLTLADGNTIVLDSMQSGQLSQQGNTRIVKLDSGLLAYQAGKGRSGATLYNMIVTPRGGQYQVILPDGTHAWLNSASSLRFPTGFTGKERRVTLTGEGYFEVAKSPGMPFVVEVGRERVNVLGTHFDIMAYADEGAIKTTLVQGSIRVNTTASSVVIRPGQQAILPADADRFQVEPANIEETIAWKDGRFIFEDRDIVTIMRQIARWYYIDVTYKDSIPGVALSGMVSRRADAGDLLKILEATKRVHFETKGNQIIVMPYKDK
jgi:transmembrane sensor